jgi:hypothetical protein
VHLEAYLGVVRHRIQQMTSLLTGRSRVGSTGAAPLVRQAWAAVHLAREPLAISAAEEAARLARETGQLRSAMMAELALATIAAERGEFTVAFPQPAPHSGGRPDLTAGVTRGWRVR